MNRSSMSQAVPKALLLGTLAIMFLVSCKKVTNQNRLILRNLAEVPLE